MSTDLESILLGQSNQPAQPTELAQPRLLGAVLAGGSSSRFGQDKALFTPAPDSANSDSGNSQSSTQNSANPNSANKPLAQLGLEALRAAGAEKVWSIGGDTDKLAALGFDAIADSEPGEGPLGGIVRALNLARWYMMSPSDPSNRDRPYANLFILACDLPWVSAATIAEIQVRMQVESEQALQADRPPPFAVFPMDEQGEVQYLHGIWSPWSAWLVSSAFRDGERSIIGGLKAVDPEQIVTCSVSQPATLRDLDRPADFA